jgi:polysaccharide deacetylase family protein (PEP-CTERM system associated)
VKGLGSFFEMAGINSVSIETKRLDSLSYFLLTIDLEDWFQVENLRPLVPHSLWPSCESRVERNTHLILDSLDRFGCSGNGGRPCSPLKATFFVLGWVAERLPGLIRQVQARGHEVASHGYNHVLGSRCSTQELRKDIVESKKILEDILGTAVHGYRAPGFSINEETLEILEESGYLYDSSFNSFSGNGRHGKIRIFPNGTGIASKTLRNLYELPISNLEVWGHTVPAGGGGYFRFMPVRIFEKIVKSVLKRNNAFVFYIHPWEVDPDQPRLKGVPGFSRLRHYTNLAKTLPRLQFLTSRLRGSSFVTCSEYLRMMSIESIPSLKRRES